MYTLNTKYEIIEHLEQYKGRYRQKGEVAEWCIRFQSPPIVSLTSKAKADLQDIEKKDILM